MKNNEFVETNYNKVVMDKTVIVLMNLEQISRKYSGQFIEVEGDQR